MARQDLVGPQHGSWPPNTGEEDTERGWNYAHALRVINEQFKELYAELAALKQELAALKATKP